MAYEAATQAASPNAYRWTDDDTAHFVRWRVARKQVFTGGRTSNVTGYKMYLEERGLEGKVTTHFLKKKWENLKQKYKELTAPPTGVSTEGGAPTAVSWKWFELMHEVLGSLPSTTPPVIFATTSGGQGTVVDNPPPAIRVEEEEEEEGEGGLRAEGTPVGRATTRKRRRLDVAEVLEDLKGQEEAEWRHMVQREERKEEMEEKRHREVLERQEAFQREILDREERWREEMRVREERRDREAAAREERRDREAAAREERRDREAAARDERLLAILEALAGR